MRKKERDLPFRNEEDGLELELTFDGEMLHSQMVLPVVRQALVERAVFFGSDVVGIARPDGLGLVELLVRHLFLLDLLRLLFLWLVLLVLYLLDLRLLVIFVRLLLLFFLSIILDFLLKSLERRTEKIE
jgi:hypothetical protein